MREDDELGQWAARYLGQAKLAVSAGVLRFRWSESEAFMGGRWRTCPTVGLPEDPNTRVAGPRQKGARGNCSLRNLAVSTSG